MKTAIIVSQIDPAGVNIKENLITHLGFEKLDEIFEADHVYAKGDIRLYTVKKDTIFCEDIDKKIDCDRIIFATEHQSAQGKPSLCVHAPGNWSKAQMGGQDRQLCPANPLLMREYFIELNNTAQDMGYEITMECTHHGPLTSVPTMFIEIGSSREQWTDKKAGETVAKTIMNVLQKPIAKKKIAFCIGGPHYCNNFNKAILRTDLAIGHVCPKHFLHELDEDMIKQAMQKSDAEIVLLDWKGLGTEKARLKELINKMKLETQRA